MREDRRLAARGDHGGNADEAASAEHDVWLEALDVPPGLKHANGNSCRVGSGLKRKVATQLPGLNRQVRNPCLGGSGPFESGMAADPEHVINRIAPPQLVHHRHGWQDMAAGSAA